MTEHPPTPIRIVSREDRSDPSDQSDRSDFRIDRVAVQVVVGRYDDLGRKIGERPCQPAILFEPLAETLPAHLTEALRAVRDAVRSEEA